MSVIYLKQMFLINFLVILCIHQICGSIDICDTGNLISELKNFTITGCSRNETVCSLKMGTKASMYLQFIPKSTIQNIQVKAKAHVNFFIDHSISIASPCETSLTCPLQAGQVQNYAAKFDVPKVPLVHNLKFTFSLWTTNTDEEILCLTSPVQLV